MTHGHLRIYTTLTDATLSLLAKLSGDGSEGVFGLYLCADLIALFLTRRILAGSHSLSGFIASPACLAQANLRIRTNRQFFLAAIDPVLGPPKLSAGWLDQQERPWESPIL